jgi:hypothetical protein
MSLIHTAERYGINVFEYLAAIIRHAQLVAASPAEWMPWNFAETVRRLELS